MHSIAPRHKHANQPIEEQGREVLVPLRASCDIGTFPQTTVPGRVSDQCIYFVLKSGLSISPGRRHASVVPLPGEPGGVAAAVVYVADASSVASCSLG